MHAVVSEVGGEKYTVVYTTTPPAADYTSTAQQATEYEMDDPFQSVLHTDLKRDLGSQARGNASDLALFDKYEFLSPGRFHCTQFVYVFANRESLGIFMGVSVFLLLFMVLYVGISAVASLQVSYFAFSKEMGPGQQKKQ